MCIQVWNVATKEQAETPAQLRKMLGVDSLIKDPVYSEIPEDCCLCPVDVKATAEAAGWGYAERNHDYMDVEVTPPIGRQSDFRLACERWHNACKLVDADHRAQKPCGKDYGLDDATADKIAADVKREWERTI